MKAAERKPLRYVPISVSGALLVSVIFFQFAVSGCGTAGDSKVSLRFKSYSTASVFDFLIKPAYAALQDTKLCIKRLRFKQDDVVSNQGSDNVDFAPAEVTLSASGSTIGEVVLPAGAYKRVEFDLEKECLGSSMAYSVSGVNDNGPFSSEETITVKFRGKFDAEGGSQVLAFGVDEIVGALEGLSSGASSSQVKTALENASGTF